MVWIMDSVMYYLNRLSMVLSCNTEKRRAERKFLCFNICFLQSKMKYLSREASLHPAAKCHQQTPGVPLLVSGAERGAEDLWCLCRGAGSPLSTTCCWGAEPSCAVCPAEEDGQRRRVARVHRSLPPARLLFDDGWVASRSPGFVFSPGGRQPACCGAAAVPTLAACAAPGEPAAAEPWAARASWAVRARDIACPGDTGLLVHVQLSLKRPGVSQTHWAPAHAVVRRLARAQDTVDFWMPNRDCFLGRKRGWTWRNYTYCSLLSLSMERGWRNKEMHQPSFLLDAWKALLRNVLNRGSCKTKAGNSGLWSRGLANKG